jgi:hypothetical protein
MIIEENTLTEVSHELNYSSVAYLSTQFKSYWIDALHVQRIVGKEENYLLIN